MAIKVGINGYGRIGRNILRALYESALCLVFPSRYEGFGLPPVEAMWCGCPVIASRAGAVPEVCGEAALWFDTARPESLGDAISCLANDTSLRETIIAAGRDRARQCLRHHRPVQSHFARHRHSRRR